MTQLTLLGIYRVQVSDEELRFIEKVAGSLENAKKLVDGLVLLELEVRGATKEFDLGLLHQVHSYQVAWDERYFAIDGSELATERFERPNQPDYRVCFFLHEFDPILGIVSPYGELSPSKVTAMPERLRKICVYEHPG